MRRFYTSPPDLLNATHLTLAEFQPLLDRDDGYRQHGSPTRYSLRLDVRIADDLAPFGALGAHESGELLGRVGGDLRAGGDHLALHVRGVVGLDQLAVQDLDHRRRGARGSEDAVPYDGLDAGEAGFRGSWHDGEHFQARGPRHRERAQLSGLDLRHDHL